MRFARLFSEKAELYTQYERTQVQGFNWLISAKATWAVKKAEEMERNQLTFTGNNSIIKSAEMPERCKFISSHDNNYDSVKEVNSDMVEAIDNALSGNFQSGSISKIVFSSNMPSRNSKAIFEVNTVFYGYKTEYEFLSDEYTRGFCGLVNLKPSEFMNEAYVTLQKGEETDEKYMKIYNEYYNEYLK